MTGLFDVSARSILIPVYIGAPHGGFTFRFALDTGATQTTIRTTSLRNLGYDLSRPVGQKRIRSATGSVVTPLFRITNILVLGHIRSDFVIGMQDLPLSVAADGLLGLDFFRGLLLKLDFHRGRISLDPPRPWWHCW